VLPLPLPSAGPALATVPSPFDPPALPIQFEYQQAQLEAEIENLSWKVERADSYDRGVSDCCPLGPSGRQGRAAVVVGPWRLAWGLEAATEKGGEGRAFDASEPVAGGGFSWPVLTGLGHASPCLASLVQDLENQMHIAEQRRRTLLKDFHDT